MPCGWLEVSAMIRSYHSYLLFTLSMPTMLFHQERKQWLVTFVVSRFVQVSLGSLFPPQSSRDAVPCASSRSEGSASEQSSQPKRASSNQEWVRPNPHNATNLKKWPWKRPHWALVTTGHSASSTQKCPSFHRGASCKVGCMTSCPVAQHRHMKISTADPQRVATVVATASWRSWPSGGYFLSKCIAALAFS